MQKQELKNGDCVTLTTLKRLKVSLSKLKSMWNTYYNSPDRRKKPGLACYNETCPMVDIRKKTSAAGPMEYTGCGALPPYEGTPKTTWKELNWNYCST